MDGESKTKLSHKQYKALLKKQKRQKQRQATARLQEELEANALPPEPFAPEEASRRDEQEEERQRQEEEDRKRAHDAWLERERQAQEEFEVKRKKEEAKKQKLLQEQQRIQEEWEARQQIENQSNNKKEQELEDILQQLDQEITEESNQPTHNPEAPPRVQPAKKEVCPFYQKTGGCRFGDRCSRAHQQPEVSTTLVLPHMYVDFTMEQSHRDEYDTDMGLEYDEGDAYQRFLEFYEDVVPEFKQIGTLVQFKVCCNWEPHLRGNVYVQFKTEEDSIRAREMFHGRFYAGKQLSCIFTPVTSWKAAICGMFHRNKCSRGKNCNFLHVFINPRQEFADADKDFKTTDRRSDQSQRGWRYGNDRNERGGRSLSRERGRYRDSQRRSHSPTWDKRRLIDRRRSRERDRHRSIRSRRPNSREKSRVDRSQSQSRSRSRSPTKSRKHRSRVDRSRSLSRSRSRSPTKSKRHRSRVDRSRSLSRSRSRSPTKSRKHRSRSRSRSRRKLSRSPSPSKHYRSRRSRSRHTKSRSQSHSRSRSPGFERCSISTMSRRQKLKEHQESSSDTDEVSKSRKRKSSKKLKKKKQSTTKEEAMIKLEHIDEIKRESNNTCSPVHETSRPEKLVKQSVGKKEHDIERMPVSSRISSANIETFDNSSSHVAMATGDIHPTIVQGESISRHCSDRESEDTSGSSEEKKSRSSSYERQVKTRPKSHKKKRKHKKHKHKNNRSSPTHSMER